VRELALRDARDAALLALPAAAALARPPISSYRVGAVGVTEAGDLVLGGNLEFPGASIHHTVHAEGFVTLRARAHGTRLAALAISEARPCAHCRQVLAEMAWADELRLIDPLGHDLALADLYPWPFTPVDLGQAGAGAPHAAAGDGPGPVVTPGVPDDVTSALADGRRRAHAPYSGEPAAVVLRLADGRLLVGAVLESVAFNPTIGPLADGLVEAVATGGDAGSITDAWLAVARDARVDHVGPTRDLLAAVAPRALLHVTYWA